MKIKDGFNFGIGFFLALLSIFAVGLFIVLTVYLTIANASDYNSNNNHNSIYDKYERNY